MLPHAPAHAAWITERLETVYKQDPRYSDKAQSLFQLDLGPPEVRASSGCKLQKQQHKQKEQQHKPAEAAAAV